MYFCFSWFIFNIMKNIRYSIIVRSSHFELKEYFYSNCFILLLTHITCIIQTAHFRRNVYHLQYDIRNTKYINVSKPKSNDKFWYIDNVKCKSISILVGWLSYTLLFQLTYDMIQIMYDIFINITYIKAETYQYLIINNSNKTWLFPMSCLSIFFLFLLNFKKKL